LQTGLCLRRTARAVWQDLVGDHGFTSRYARVGRFVSKLRGAASPIAHPRIVTEPGQENQVDYGTGPTGRDAAATHRSVGARSS